MVQVLPNILLTASHTKTTPLELTAAVFTAYNVKNKSADVAVLVSVNDGDWLRIRPLSEGIASAANGAAVTKLEFALHDSPRWASLLDYPVTPGQPPKYIVRHAQSAQVEISPR